jgi:DNA polymerase-1
MTIYELYEKIELPSARIFQSMSNRGICVDLKYLEGLRTTLLAQKEPLEQEIKNELGAINLNSPKQLLEALNEKGIKPYLKGKPSTDKRALAYFAGNPIVQRLLEYSQIDTLLSSFVIPYLERKESVVHPFFNQVGTRTGRLSCSNPNLLQIPKHGENGKLVRSMFIPRPGMVLGDCDFGQIEPRILAHFSKDPTLCGLFREGTDFHSFTAERLKISRDRAKVLNLSVGYRATYKSVSQQLKCGEKEAQNEIDKWWELFPVLRRWQDTLLYESKRSGFITTLLGRRIKIDDLSHGNSWRREGAERQCINNITQGSAAEVMKLAMIRSVQHIPYLGLLIQVYDQLVFESPINDMPGCMRAVTYCMENAIALEVPLTVDCKTGITWGNVV